MSERRDMQLRRGRWLIGLCALVLAGCTVHLVTINLPESKTKDAKAVTSQPATTQPARKKSFIEMLIEDVAN